MLFSSTDVATFINDTFEPAWESVRPVPIVSIDFGNGTKVTRTLNGNIATYVCSADGRVADILPGIYQPDVYKDELRRLRLLELTLRRPAKSGDPFKDYHVRRALGLKQEPPKPPAPAVAASPPPQTGFGGYTFNGFGGFGSYAAGFQGNIPNGFSQLGGLGGQFGFKGSIESPVKRAVAAKPVPPLPPAPAKAVASGGKVNGWPELAEDTRLNETVRRLQIHEKLTETGRVTPESLKKWVYKEVLHADLDDPYLGLHDLLYARYPFAAEENQRPAPVAP